MTINFNPTYTAEINGLHAALGALFVTLPASLWAMHPHWHFCYGHPRLVGSFTGIVYAWVKEMYWDQNMEDAVTRGSNWTDFFCYVFGITIANLILFV